MSADTKHLSRMCDRTDRLVKGLTIVSSSIACEHITVLCFDEELSTMWRAFSTVTGFAVGGAKPMPGPVWKSRVAIKKEALITNGAKQLAIVFPDYEKILEAGHDTVINLPVVLENLCIGSVNCLIESSRMNLPTRAEIDAVVVMLNSSDFPCALAEFKGEPK